MQSIQWKMQKTVAQETGFAPFPDAEIQAAVDDIKRLKVIVSADISIYV